MLNCATILNLVYIRSRGCRNIQTFLLDSINALKPSVIVSDQIKVKKSASITFKIINQSKYASGF